jgi:hypothetical protein
MCLLSGITACNEDKVFENEQYKTVFALVSNDDYNIFQVVHDLDQPESVGYVSASCGGTKSSEKDIEISLVQDMEAFDDYNTSNYDVDVSSYARLLPENRYDIDSYNLTIPAGERNGRMTIRIRPDGLSPDSIYFIPVKIDTYSAYEVNPDKSNVLYRVLIKNQYATQESPTNYTMRAYRGTMQIPGQKTMHPISRNKVRIMADNITFQADIDDINTNGIILEITEENKVLISPVKDLNVTQVDGDPDFPNIFRIENTGYKKYKTFLLRYNYVDKNGVTQQMKEELRLEFTE